MKLIKKLFFRVLFWKRFLKEKRHSLVGAAKYWKLKRDFQFSFLMKNGLNPENIFLDLGCGTLRGGIPIIKFLNESNYWGVDIREEAIREAHDELKSENLENKNPTLLSFKTFDDLKPSLKFDVILSFSVLIHMEDHIVDECFGFVSKVLANEGKYFANVNIGNRIIGKWDRFPVVAKEITFYENLAQKYGLKMENLGILKDLGHVTLDQAQDSQVMLKFSK